MRKPVRKGLSAYVSITLAAVLVALLVDGPIAPSNPALSFRPPSKTVSVQAVAILHFP